jgi:hypothetical protein
MTGGCLVAAPIIRHRRQARPSPTNAIQAGGLPSRFRHHRGPRIHGRPDRTTAAAGRSSKSLAWDYHLGVTCSVFSSGSRRHDDGHWDAGIEAYCLLDVLKPLDGRHIGSLALCRRSQRSRLAGVQFSARLASKPLFSCFVVVLDRDGLDRESGPIGEAVDINDGSVPSCRLTDGADIHAQRWQIRKSAVPEPNR